MNSADFKFSDRYMIVETETDSIPKAIETLSDSGRFYSIVRAEDVGPEYQDIAKPALVEKETGNIVIENGRITIRWAPGFEVPDNVLADYRATMERKYKNGGIIRIGPKKNLIKLAQILGHLTGVQSANIQILKKRHTRK